MIWSICGEMPPRKNTMLPIKHELTKALSDVLKKVLGQNDVPIDIDLTFEVPREEKFGDISTHVALRLAKELKKVGYNVARRTVAKYREQLKIPVARLRREL